MKEHQISFDEYNAEAIPTEYDAFLAAAPTAEIQGAFCKHYTKFREYDGSAGEFSSILVSVSGGADSDRMIDLIERIGYPKGAVTYAHYDTGMEYRATKEHLKWLEIHYGITIKRVHAKMPVAIAVKKYGYPFLSKKISQNIYRLQKHGFTWEDGSLEELLKRWPRCKSALRWWCNEWGPTSRLNINRRKWLKEFLIEHPPRIPISDKCCQKAKKDTAHEVEHLIAADLSVVGVRKAEGGARECAYSSCFDKSDFGCSMLRPLFWLKKSDCMAYDDSFGVTHSALYCIYGLDREGCACCPFGKNFEKELEAVKTYEPAIYRLANMVFGPSFEYTRQYIEYRDRRNKEEKEARYAEG